MAAGTEALGVQGRLGVGISVKGLVAQSKKHVAGDLLTL